MAWEIRKCSAYEPNGLLAILEYRFVFVYLWVKIEWSWYSECVCLNVASMTYMKCYVSKYFSLWFVAHRTLQKLKINSHRNLCSSIFRCKNAVHYASVVFLLCLAELHRFLLVCSWKKNKHQISPKSMNADSKQKKKSEQMQKSHLSIVAWKSKM